MVTACEDAAREQMQPLALMTSDEAKYELQQDGNYLVRTKVSHGSDSWDVSCVVTLTDAQVISVKTEPRY